MVVLSRVVHLVKFSKVFIESNPNPLKTATRVFSVTHHKSFSSESNWGTNKKHRKVKIADYLNMSDPKIEEVLAPLRQQVKEQVRKSL